MHEIINSKFENIFTKSFLLSTYGVYISLSGNNKQFSKLNNYLIILKKYLLKCAQHMPDFFSTENLSIHHKILIGLKDRFDLHKLP